MATIDPITGLPSSNVQTVYIGDKPISTVPAPTPSVDATKIGTTTVTPVPTPQTTQIPSITQPVGYISSATKTAEEQAVQQAQMEADARKAATQAMMTDYAQAQAALGGKAGDLATAYSTKDSTGQSVNDLAAQLRQLNAQALGLQNEAQAIPIQIQNQSVGQGVTDRGVAPIEAARLRDNALKALSLGQQAAIAKADYETAKSYADQMVEAKYSQMEANLKSKEIQLKWAMEQDLAPAQKKLADAQARQIEAQKQEIADKKAEAKAVNELMTNAYAQGVPSKIAEKAKAIQERGGTQAEVAAALGVYSGDYLSRQIKLAQLSEIGLKNKKALQKLYGNGSGLKTLTFEENAKFNSTPEAKGIKDATAYAKAVSDYKSAIEKYGTGELFGKGSGELGQAYSALVGATKDYYTLGTLDNGVQKLIALGIPEPGLIGLKSGRIDALDTALNAAADTIKRNSDQLLSTGYKNTNELKQLIDNAGGVLMYRMSNQDLLNLVPGSGQGNTNTTSTNQTFFNK